MGSTLQQVLDSGDLNSLAGALKKILFGTRTKEAGARQVRETLTVTSNAATPTYKVERIVICATTTTGTRTRRVPVENTATLSTGQCKGTDSSALGTKAITFYASDVADGSTADVTYWTFDDVANASAITADYGSTY